VGGGCSFVGRPCFAEDNGCGSGKVTEL
jgi:hypothetical protein